MTDTRKRKYKGKVCAPPAATTAAVKSTKHWCKGKVGREHVPVLLYNAKPEENWGLATEVTERCERCDKVLRHSYELPQPTHSFDEIVRAIVRARGVDFGEPEMIPPYLIVPAIRYMQDIADQLGVVMTIEFHEKPKGNRRWWGRAVRMTTGPEVAGE